MKMVLIAGSKVGSKTRIAMDHTLKVAKKNYREVEFILLDIAGDEIVVSDGRNNIEYDGSRKYVEETIMSADGIMIGTTKVQASIPAKLKNIFGLLQVNALRDKVVRTLVTARSAKHN